MPFVIDQICRECGNTFKVDKYYTANPRETVCLDCLNIEVGDTLSFWERDRVGIGRSGDVTGFNAAGYPLVDNGTLAVRPEQIRTVLKAKEEQEIMPVIATLKEEQGVLGAYIRVNGEVSKFIPGNYSGIALNTQMLTEAILAIYPGALFVSNIAFDTWENTLDDNIEVKRYSSPPISKAADWLWADSREEQA